MADALWKQFEKSVAAFIESLGWGAKVAHDRKQPDKHTGRTRQRDVWVEWNIGGHFPVRALVSCKRWSKPLNQKHIDDFNGEFMSSKAQVGIIYSFNGFNKNAISKAKELGFSCCRLYENQPPEIPERLIFGLAHHVMVHPQLGYSGNPAQFGFETWNDLFDLKYEGRTVREVFQEALEQHQDVTDRHRRWKTITDGTNWTFTLEVEGLPPFKVHFKIRDRVFRALLAYSRVDGSYNFSTDQFVGSQTTPYIDTWSNDSPGDGWEPLDVLPTSCPSLLFFSTVCPQKGFERLGSEPLVKKPA